MEQLQLTIVIDEANADAVCLCLEQLQATAITLSPYSEEELLEPKPDSTPLWATTKVTAFMELTKESELALVIPILEAAFNSSITISKIPIEDKVAEPITSLIINNKLAILQPDLPVVRLSSNLAFGTGNHQTTQLALEYLTNYALKDQVVIDYGCGSGILGISATLLGAQQVFAIDYDAQAVFSSKQNALANNLPPSKFIALLDTELKEVPKANLIIANILLNPLIELKPIFTNLACPGTTLVVTGILQHQVPLLLAAYKDLQPGAIVYKNEWALVELWF